ncbi:unnamed protein product [Rhodiola kirilowii]
MSKCLHLVLLLSLVISLIMAAVPSSADRPSPYVMRISCGARQNVQTAPTNTLWHKDFAYTGGIPANAILPSFIAPRLQTLRYFATSSGPENCYNINRVPKGHYLVRIFFGVVSSLHVEDIEPLFDVSLEGTQICSLKSGWTNHDEESFCEAITELTDGTASICFHSTGHGDPAVVAIEILQVDSNAYYLGPDWGEGTVLRAAERLSCGDNKPKFDSNYNGNHRGGDRFWNYISSFLQSADSAIKVQSAIKNAYAAPNFYPAALYQTAIVGTDIKPDLEYSLEVDPNKNYSVWLHFAEIDKSITGIGQRVFDILINGDTLFQDVDIVSKTGGLYTALVLNTTAYVSGRALIITIQPTKGHAIINAIEVFEIITAESKTVVNEVRGLQSLKRDLGLPSRFGWNGDPCVPQQHPWTGVDCQLDRNISRWVIDGLGLDNQGLRGFLPNDVSKLSHLQSIDLSGNSIGGPIPSSIGNITSLRILDLSYNSFNGSIPESLGQLTELQKLYLNGNSLWGRVPAAVGGMLIHGASFNFTDNSGLCGIPGLPTCGPHLSTAQKIGIAIGSLVALLLIATCLTCWWKRRQNILKAQRIAAAREAPYAKARTNFSRDVQMGRHHSQDNHNNHGHNQNHTWTAAENSASILS